MLKTHIVSFRNTEVAFKAKDDKALKKSYRLFKLMNKSWLLKPGMSLTKLALSLRIPIEPIIKKTIFRHFCGGESLKDCTPVIASLHKHNINAILDFSVEGAFKTDMLDKTRDEIINTVKFAANNAHIPFAVFKITGICFPEILEKKQTDELYSAEDQAKFDRAFKRVGQICREASDNDVKVLIDAEESWMQEAIDEIAFEMIKTYNKNKAVVFNTFQMYCKDSLEKLKQAIEKAHAVGYKLGVKLVRGAYMEKEREHAALKETSSPIHSSKANTDEAYNDALVLCLQNLDTVELFAGTHNEYSCYHLANLMQVYNIAFNDKRIWFSQLYGMGDHISFNLAAKGFNVAKYVPYGKVKYVMPYLFRRAQENTSVADQASREFKLLQWEMRRRGL